MESTTTTKADKTDEQMVQACFAAAQREADREGAQLDYPDWSACEVDRKRSTVSIAHPRDWAIIFSFAVDRLGRVRFMRDEAATDKAQRKIKRTGWWQ